MPARHLILLRHGAVENPRGVVYGDLPGFPLSPAGRAQIGIQADRLRHFQVTKILTSPLTRATETAEIMRAAAWPDVTVQQEPRLTEWVDWRRGLTEQQWRTRHPELAAQLDHDPTALPEEVDGQKYETLAAVRERVRSVVGECRSAGDNYTLLVSHGGPLTALLADLTGLDYVTAAQRYDLRLGQAYLATLTATGPQIEFLG